MLHQGRSICSLNNLPYTRAIEAMSMQCFLRAKETYLATEVCKSTTEVREDQGLGAKLACKVARHGRCAVLRNTCFDVHVGREGGLMRQQVSRSPHVCTGQI